MIWKLRWENKLSDLEFHKEHHLLDIGAYTHASEESMLFRMRDCEIRCHTNLTTVRGWKLSKFDYCLLEIWRLWQEVQNLK